MIQRGNSNLDLEERFTREVRSACNPDDEAMTTVVLATASLFVNGHGEVENRMGRKPFCTSDQSWLSLCGVAYLSQQPLRRVGLIPCCVAQ